MRKIIFCFLLIFVLAGCDREFEPRLTGWSAYTHPARKIFIDMDGRKKTITLPGDDKTTYRYPQWTKSDDQVLLTQISKTDQCNQYQIISMDTAGMITDTIYTAPSHIAVNFKLAPNDTLLLLKTYTDDCTGESNGSKYFLYNRYSKINLPDTIAMGNSRGIHLNETVWSPDSRKVIVSEWSAGLVRAFVYNTVTKDTTYIDRGSNFIWSPVDNNLVAYIKDYSIYTKNLITGEKELIFQGKRKRSATAFRWNPDGDFIMINIRSYLLNIDAQPLKSSTIVYLSWNDKRESRTYYDERRFDTWKIGNRIK